MKKIRAFTFIELMIVLIIFGVFATIGIGYVLKTEDKVTTTTENLKGSTGAISKLKTIKSESDY
ncbi:MAG: prepilin-type N-terminal cleavage/methylation domain-containing protein [Alphaproteobacteria bacterium]|nr:prepilin-type N-terminal cleavage/methylation domain-containing protein [Alphaproteobacteria bacterium]